jgi:hypothetical protein
MRRAFMVQLGAAPIIGFAPVYPDRRWFNHA